VASAATIEPFPLRDLLTGCACRGMFLKYYYTYTHTTPLPGINMDLLLIRTIERLIAILVGGFAIYLGYRLFFSVKVTGEGAAKVKLPGDVTIMLSRIAPGVFFALFGAVVVGASLMNPISYSEDEIESTDEKISKREITGIGEVNNLPDTESEHPAQELSFERIRVQENIRFLNQVPGLSDPGLSAEKQKRMKSEILRLKLRLMKLVWGENWGSYEEFELWAEGGAKPAGTKEFQAAVQFFETGQ
jgi:hypothetical protein